MGCTFGVIWASLVGCLSVGLGCFRRLLECVSVSLGVCLDVFVCLLECAFDSGLFWVDLLFRFEFGFCECLCVGV